MSAKCECILAIFAHPDDETSCAGGTMALYAGQGVEVHVVTATGGELGTLGTGQQRISREELASVRQAELASVLDIYGVGPPIMLGYRDQELQYADSEQIIARLTEVMNKVHPTVVITFGPTGISGHDDHVAIHRATVEAFHRYRQNNGSAPRLFYVALTREISDGFGMDLDGPEVEPTVNINIQQQKAMKIKALQTYTSQEDAQWLAGLMESSPMGDQEMFHQAYPPATAGQIATGFW